MPTVSGKVSAVYAGRQPNTYVVYMQGKKYWGRGATPQLAKGDTVTITYSEKTVGGKTYLNITNIQKTQQQQGKNEKVRGRPADQERRIVRQSLIGSLCTLYAGSGKNIEEIIALVKRLEQFVYEGK